MQTVRVCFWTEASSPTMPNTPFFAKEGVSVFVCIVFCWMFISTWWYKKLTACQHWNGIIIFRTVIVGRFGHVRRNWCHTMLSDVISCWNSILILIRLCVKIVSMLPKENWTLCSFGLLKYRNVTSVWLLIKMSKACHCATLRRTTLIYKTKGGNQKFTSEEYKGGEFGK